MILPKAVLEDIRRDPQVAGHLRRSIDGEPLPGGGVDTSLETWMVREGFQRSAAVRHYLSYLFDLYEAYWNIFKYFPKENPGREGGREFGTLASSPLEILHIARYLYYLWSEGVEGDVLECGCFKGYSSCCLSLACRRLGRRLVVADSFQGLPTEMTADENSYYKPGDFHGSFDEVHSNIKTFGAVDSVDFVRGWFKDSLRSFDRRICVLWLDVDLYQSARDVLDLTYDRLVPGGVIFSHEIQPASINGAGKMSTDSSSVTRAFADFLNERGIEHRAKYLTGFIGIVMPETAEPPAVSTARLAALLKENEWMNAHARQPLLDVSEYEHAESYVGFLDAVEDGRVRGWAWNRATPGDPVTVDLYAGEALFASVEASAFRPDLTFLGDGRCGFSYDLPRDLPWDGGVEISARYHGTRCSLANSPLRGSRP